MLRVVSMEICVGVDGNNRSVASVRLQERSEKNRSFGRFFG